MLLWKPKLNQKKFGDNFDQSTVVTSFLFNGANMYPCARALRELSKMKNLNRYSLTQKLVVVFTYFVSGLISSSGGAFSQFDVKFDDKIPKPLCKFSLLPMTSYLSANMM